MILNTAQSALLIYLPHVAAFIFLLVLSDCYISVVCFVYTSLYVFILKFNLTLHVFCITHFPIDKIVVIF